MDAHGCTACVGVRAWGLSQFFEETWDCPPPTRMSVNRFIFSWCVAEAD